MQTAAALRSCLLDGGFDISSASFIFPAHSCCSSSRKVRLRRWCTLQGACWQEEIRPITIIHTHLLEVGQDAGGVQRLFPSFGMDGKVCQVLCRVDILPLTLACHIEARFILMQHLCTTERSFDLLLHSFPLLCTALDQGLQGPHIYRTQSRSSTTSLAHLYRTNRGTHQINVTAPNAVSYCTGARMSREKGALLIC